MNEPSISSPFGPDDETRSERGPLPLPLKILVGIEIGRIGVTCVLALLKYGWSSPALTLFTLNALFFLLCVLLLQGSKVSWWLIQLWSVPGVLYRIADALIHRVDHRPISLLYPDSISWLFLAQELILFAYLFTPQARRYFFARHQATP